MIRSITRKGATCELERGEVGEEGGLAKSL